MHKLQPLGTIALLFGLALTTPGLLAQSASSAGSATTAPASAAPDYPVDRAVFYDTAGELRIGVRQVPDTNG